MGAEEGGEDKGCEGDCEVAVVADGCVDAKVEALLRDIA